MSLIKVPAEASAFAGGACGDAAAAAFPAPVGFPATGLHLQLGHRQDPVTLTCRAAAGAGSPACAARGGPALQPGRGARQQVAHQTLEDTFVAAATAAVVSIMYALVRFGWPALTGVGFACSFHDWSSDSFVI